MTFFIDCLSVCEKWYPGYCSHTQGNNNHSTKTGLNYFYNSHKNGPGQFAIKEVKFSFKNQFDFGYGICYVNLNFFQQKIIKTEKTFCLIGDNLIEPVHN